MHDKTTNSGLGSAIGALALMSSASLPRNPRPTSCAASEKVSRSMAASWSSARPARTISVRMHSSSSPTAIGMPVSCACAACALGALRPPLIIGGRTSGGASASGSVSPPVARYQVHAPSPGASLAGAYVLEATTAPPERGRPREAVGPEGFDPANGAWYAMATARTERACGANPW